MKARTPRLKDEHRGSRAVGDRVQAKEEAERLMLQRRQEATQKLREEIRSDLEISAHGVRIRLRVELKGLRERAADILAQANRIEAILEDL